MVSDNIRKIALGKIIDFDAVSLYPSAIRRGYYPSGKAHELTKELIDYYNVPANLFKIGEKRDC